MIPHHIFSKHPKFQISDDKKMVKIYGETNLNEYNLIVEFPREVIEMIYEVLK
jgi:hypothetical protein